LADLPLARETVFGSGYQDITALPIEVLRSFLLPMIGTPERAHQFEQLIVSLQPEDLLAVEPDLARLEVPTLIVWGTADTFFELSWAYWLKDLIPGAIDVVEIEGGRLFFPDERSGELVSSLREHWAALAAA
jgi:pimeloyl-ACP methyl ester carboxylesterase